MVRAVEAVAFRMLRARPSLHGPAQPDHAELHTGTLNHRELREVTPRPHHRRARRGPIAAVHALRRHRPALRQRYVGMRPTEHQRHPKQLHLKPQTQPALKIATRHPAALLLAAPRHPPPPRRLRDAQHLRCRCPPSSSDASDVKPPADEAEAEQVPSGEEGTGEAQRELVRCGGEEVGSVPRPARLSEALIILRYRGNYV